MKKNKIGKNEVYDIAVIGAGAAGLTAAIQAASQNVRVALLEADERPGRKLLATGNGKCNFTHEHITPKAYHTDCPEVLGKILESFSTGEALSFFSDLGMLWKEKEGYYYPESEQAKTVLELLLLKCREEKVDLITETGNISIVRSETGFVIRGMEIPLYSKKVILATGSRAGGFCKKNNQNPYHIGKELFLSCSPLHPSLTKCICKEKFYPDIAGIRAQSVLSLYVDEKRICEENGEIQLTQKGISGIVVFQLSGKIADALALGKKVVVEIDYLPGLKDKDCEDFLEERKIHFSNRKAGDFFYGITADKLMKLFLRLSHIDEKRMIKEYSMEKIKAVLHMAKHFQTEILKLAEMEEAQVCRGGFYLSQFTNNLESKEIPGLYACGEVLNVDGICGGYNLHWAWASGSVAGHHAGESCHA